MEGENVKVRMLKDAAKIFICVLLILIVLAEDGNCVNAAENTVIDTTDTNKNEKIECQVKGAKVSKKAKKAITAYQKYLGADKIKWGGTTYKSNDYKFSLVDVNKDGIPELFLNCKVACHAEGYETFYCYYKNKVTEVGVSMDKIKSYYPKSGIIEMYYFGMGDAVSYYKVSKGGASKLMGSADSFNDPMQKAYYEWRGKKVTASKFKSLLKKEAGNKKVKVTSSFWYENTAENRANMIELVKW